MRGSDRLSEATAEQQTCESRSEVSELLTLPDDQLLEILEAADALDDQLNLASECREADNHQETAVESCLVGFLGSLGNRYGALQGGCGGLWVQIEGRLALIDPGPSAISILQSYPSQTDINLSLSNLDAILCSHIHHDHSGNLISVIEGMTCGMKVARGMVVGNSTVICALSETDPYYFSKTRPVILHPHMSSRSVLSSGCPSEPQSAVRMGGLAILPTPTRHLESRGQTGTGIGFYLSGRRQDVWYTGDTALFEGLLDYVGDLASDSKPLVIVANGGGAHERPKSMTLCTRDLAVLACELSPKYLVIQHYDRAYSAARYRVGQAIAIQRMLDGNQIGTSVLPSTNGLFLIWDRFGDVAFRSLTKDRISLVVAEYLSQLGIARSAF